MSSLVTQDYRIWVNEERTVLVTLWIARRMLTVARRNHPSHTWGPPEYLTEESPASIQESREGE